MSEYIYRFGFADQLAFSRNSMADEVIQTILNDKIPGAILVEKSNTEQDRNGTDYWVYRRCGENLSVDVKVRSKDWAGNDLALETYSVISLNNTKIGWTLDESKRTDYILWYWTDSKRYCLVPFPPLCHVFQIHWKEWKSKFKTKPQVTKYPNSKTCDDGFLSECVFVPNDVVWSAIQRHCSGKAAPNA